MKQPSLWPSAMILHCFCLSQLWFKLLEQKAVPLKEARHEIPDHSAGISHAVPRQGGPGTSIYLETKANEYQILMHYMIEMQWCCQIL